MLPVAQKNAKNAKNREGDEDLELGAHNNAKRAKRGKDPFIERERSLNRQRRDIERRRKMK
jgi:hypothetical protein